VLLASTESPLADLRFVRPIDLSGRIHALDDFTLNRVGVFAFLPTDEASAGPIADALQKRSSGGDDTLAYFAVVPGGSRRADVKSLADRHGLTVPILVDATGEIAAALRPTVDDGVVVVRAGDILCRASLIGPSSERLNSTLADVAQQKAVDPTTPTGEANPSYPQEEVTFTRHIAPIMYAHCSECHRPGQVAPFSLLTFDDASKRASHLVDVTRSGLMPPWKAEIGYGHFEGERRLTSRQQQLMADWVKAGTPRGDDADLPPSPSFADGWRLGTPDLVVEVPEPYPVPADGPDIFQHFVLPVELPEGKTIVGFEYRPSNPAVAHHAVVFLDSSGRARQLDAETPEPGYRTSGSVGGGVTALVGVWTPGNTPRPYPDGIGLSLPKKVDIVLQLHLHPTGKPETEQSKVGLYFADKPAEQMRRQDMLLLGSLAIDIPPGQERHAIGSSFVLPIEVSLLSVFPHLHLIGKEMKVTATLPNGEEKPIIWIKDWNFYWQDSYQYREPVTLPKGTRIRVEAAYNNSPDNPRNPSQPPQRVLFGNGSTDEMCFAFFQIVSDQKDVMARLGPSLIQSFVSEWRKADIDDEARVKIVDEAGKLFGPGAGSMLKRILLKPTTEPAKS
jgi:mono/diheme cytochrome c family protein